jgi:phage-related minor tail protein
MEAHRIGYQKALDAYKDIHKAAANVDPREKLGKIHLEEGRRLTQMIAAAGKALDDARDEIAAESLVVRV